MAPDYRSEKSESIEGKGIARRAWDAYARKVNRAGLPLVKPLVMPAARRLAASQVSDLVGFWVMWHLHGGFEGLEEYGMHRTTIFRKVSRFRTVFGVHPDEYQLQGVEIDPFRYWKSAGRKAG